MSYISYETKQVEQAKQMLLLPYFQERVNAGEINLLTALMQQSKISADIDDARKQIECGEYVDADNLLESVKKKAQEKIANASQ